MTRLIEEEGVHVDAIDYNTGNTGLHAAVLLRNGGLVTYLIDKGANCNARNRKGLKKKNHEQNSNFIS